MVAESLLDAMAQLSKASQPSMGWLLDPAVLVLFLAAFNTRPCNATENALLLQVASTALSVVALTCMK